MLWKATLSPNLDSARRARADAMHVLEDAGVPPPVIDDALLVLGEVASNAARHARTEFTITLILENETLRLEVFDRDTRPLFSDSTPSRPADEDSIW